MYDGNVCLDLAGGVDAVRTGRRFVVEQLHARGASELVDVVALVAAELLANAHQHGQAPVIVCVAGHSGVLRVEVRDGSSRAPVRAIPSSSDMTGRGLTLVEALTSRWGVERGPGNGKTVWAEFEAHTWSGPGQAQADAVLAEWLDDSAPTRDERFTVELGDVPTDLLLKAKAHIDNVVRELSLAEGGSTERAVPEHYQRLIQTVVHGFSDARHAIKRQALAAAARGERRTRLVLELPASAAEAGEAYLAALDEADTYSRAARLLTLETPPDHRLFRRWYVEAVVEQLRDLAAGRTTHQVLPFEDLLVSEIRRLSASQVVGQRAVRLQRVTAALAQATAPEDVAAVVVSEGVDALGASGGGLLVPSADGEHLAVPGVVGYEGVLVDALREERLDAPLPAATALRTGRAIWLESREERDRHFPALRGFEAATISMCAIPLVVSGRILGALRFSFAVRKIFDEDERGFVFALAAQTAQTLQRTESYQAERTAAIELQRALLPNDMPTIDGWDVAAYYSPAGDQEVGGDFYDVLPVEGGRIVAIVGDVMGRGLDAAASMAQVRSVIRAYALQDPDPVAVFRRVDAFFDALALPQLVTVSYFLLDPDTGVVEVASAGHLPPLLIDSGSSRAVQISNGPPFGVGVMARQAVTVQLPPGAALVAITDGLVERRGEDIDEGVARILRSTAGAEHVRAGGLLTRIVDASAAHGGRDDDVTVLVLRRD